MVDSSHEISTTNTVIPRYIAAILDNLLAIFLSVVAAKSVGEDKYVLQTVLVASVYLGYYFLFEAVISRTPGKLLTGLVVVRANGRRTSLRDVTIRTLFRILEVNPAFFGALPAAVCIVLTRNHQRMGDRFAGTIVVPSRRVRK